MKTSRDYFIKVEDKLIPVERSLYSEYYSMRRREKYLDERDRKNKLCSYNCLGEKELSGEEVLKDFEADTEEKYTMKAMSRRLYEVLALLKLDELVVIYQVYFCEKTEREVAVLLGISKSSVHYRKRKILNKLRELY